MEVNGLSRKRSAVDTMWNWNVTDFKIKMINPSVSNAFQVSPKRHCNGLQYANTPTNTLPMAPVYQKHIPSNLAQQIQQQQQQQQWDTQMLGDDTNVEDMETQTSISTNPQVTNKTSVCLRCLAGEPGHIMHML